VAEETEGSLATEEPMRAAHASGDFDEVAERAIEAYGDELGRYLAALARNPDDAAEAFSQLWEDFLRGLPAFRFEASLRTWAYTLARNALFRGARAPARREQNRVPLSRPDAQRALDDMKAQVRERTAAWRRTSVKDRLHAIRESLPREDRELLILRVDRGLSWQEVARVTAATELDDAELRRSAAGLRKRFERLKARLEKLAQAEGLLPPKES
jgi:RNA polymerase sigma-70 factor (ECF subfamily)